MFDFLKKKQTISKVRVWAEKQQEKNEREGKSSDDYNDVLVRMLSDALLYGISRFCDPKVIVREDTPMYKMSKENRLHYSGDSCLFEVGCYVYSHIDMWHFQNTMEEERAIVDHLVKQSLLIFQESLDMNNLQEIYDNRKHLYARLIRDSKNPQDELLFYLTQLLIRAKDNAIPKEYDFDEFPVIIIDTFEELTLGIEIKSFNECIMPECIKNIQKYHQIKSENHLT